jgi:hypothetical protein
MLRLEKLRELTLRTAPAQGRPRHLSAASGLVRVEDRLYVIADDEHQLGVFSAEGSEPGTLLTVLPGRLPDGTLERKAAKADLEALTRLPTMMEFPHGVLFALGSGSRPNREAGALIELDAWGLASAPAIQVNLHRLYSALRTRLPALNVEGAFTTAEHFCLLHRGNKRDSTNACIRLPLRTALDALAAGSPVLATPPLDVRTFDLGAIRGVPLCFTDGAALPDGRFVFTAVAEDTEDNYADGPCLGAAVGLVDADGRVCALEQLEQCHKIEGVAAQLDGGVIHLLLVTDPDDPALPGTVLAGTLR